MILTLTICLLYLACVGFYHAGKTRTVFNQMQVSAASRFALRSSAWGVSIATLFLLSGNQGWERGVPVWLGLITLAGVASLLVSALIPRYHSATGIVAAAAGTVATVLWITEGLV